MSYLRDSDREALRLAHDLREEMRVWLAGRGSSAPVSVSPFVDPSGQPSVLVTMSAEVARAIAGMLAEQRSPAGGGFSGDAGFPQRVNDTGGLPAVTDTGGLRALNDTGGLRAVHDTGGLRPVAHTAGFQQGHDTGATQIPSQGTGGFVQPINAINAAGALPQPVAGTGGFPRPVGGTGGYAQPVGGAGFPGSYPQTAPPHGG